MAQEFLNDYGMVWVGSGHTEKSGNDSQPQAGLWHPEESIPSDTSFTADYDKVLKNIEILNGFAGDGSLKIESTSQRGSLKVIYSSEWSNEGDTVRGCFFLIWLLFMLFYFYINLILFNCFVFKSLIIT